MPTPICRIRLVCVRAASGHTGAPPSSVMNSRRFMSDKLAIRIETRKHETRFVNLERVAGRNLGGAAQINADSSGHARAPRRRPAADFTLPCRRRPNSRSPRPPTGDRRAALLGCQNVNAAPDCPNAHSARSCVPASYAALSSSTDVSC